MSVFVHEAVAPDRSERRDIRRRRVCKARGGCWRVLPERAAGSLLVVMVDVAGDEALALAQPTVAWKLRNSVQVTAERVSAGPMPWFLRICYTVGAIGPDPHPQARFRAPRGPSHRPRPVALASRAPSRPRYTETSQTPLPRFLNDPCIGSNLREPCDRLGWGMG